MTSFTSSLRAICALLLAGTASAQTADVVEAELLPGWRDGDRHIAAIQLRLAPGWKTYWRAPGDAGIPPVFDWSGSTNLSSFAVEFPVPDVFDQAGMRSIGYEDEVTFPIVLGVIDQSQPIGLQGAVAIGVCKDVCIPVTFSIAGDLTAPGAPSEVIAAARANRASAGARMTCEIAPISDGLRVQIKMPAPDMGRDASMVIETADPSVWVSEPEVEHRGETVTATADLVPPDAAPFALARDGLRVTFLDAGRAIETLGCN